MRRIWVFILLLAVSSQLSAVSGQQNFSESENLKTSESEKGSEPRAMSNEQRFRKAQSPSQVFSFSDSQIQYYENQIRLADSLYKNYLPQSNFEEVKAAMEFFDNVQLSAISRQRWRLFDKKVTDENMLIAESRLLTDAKAHYYHAVGLTEHDDIVGACEHYQNALEIMEPLVETSPLWRLRTSTLTHI